MYQWCKIRVIKLVYLSELDFNTVDKAISQSRTLQPPTKSSTRLLTHRLSVYYPPRPRGFIDLPSSLDINSIYFTCLNLSCRLGLRSRNMSAQQVPQRGRWQEKSGSNPEYVEVIEVFYASIISRGFF
jgi:hypothetical protein